MTTVSITDLRDNFPRVEQLLRQGQDVFVTRRGIVIARLIPEPGYFAGKLIKSGSLSG